jgi:hypothetical protein
MVHILNKNRGSNWDGDRRWVGGGRIGFKGGSSHRR